jgi:hypothetical protein
MTRHYSTKDFFRHMPNALLARYFAGHAVFCEFDFAAMSETRHDELFAAWLALPEAQRNTMDAEFRDIFEMSCEKGYHAILENIKDTHVNFWQTTTQKTAPNTGRPFRS